MSAGPAAAEVDGLLAGLPSLAETVRLGGLRATKALGQHFLLDQRLLDRIVALSPLKPGERAYEVGPGPGGLTRALVARGARVLAVERDGRAVRALAPLVAAAQGRLELVEADALGHDPRSWAGPEGAHIVANLPYNIGTPLVVRWLSDDEPWWRSATLMLQREVAERMVAGPSTPAYGRLSVLVAARARARIALSVGPGAFRPPPKVASAVVRLDPAARAEGAPSLQALEAVTRAAFGQRRKMLRQAMRALAGGAEALAASGIDPAARAETLDLSAFEALAQAWEAMDADATRPGCAAGHG